MTIDDSWCQKPGDIIELIGGQIKLLSGYVYSKDSYYAVDVEFYQNTKMFVSIGKPFWITPSDIFLYSIHKEVSK